MGVHLWRLFLDHPNVTNLPIRAPRVDVERSVHTKIKAATKAHWPSQLSIPSESATSKGAQPLDILQQHFRNQDEAGRRRHQVVEARERHADEM